MTTLLAIDPGTHQSGFVVLQGGRVLESDHECDNERLLAMVEGGNCPFGDWLLADACAIEMIASYGMPVGAEVFETCVWIGRFVEAWRRRTGHEPARIKRPDVKLHLCHSARAKDGNVRQALIDRLGAPGTKKAPGATYGVSSHAWAALAVGVTFLDQLAARESQLHQPAKDRPNSTAPC